MLHPRAQAFIEAGTDGDYPHIASPDIWIDHAAREIRLYFHGRLEDGSQRTRVAVSKDGLQFYAREPILANAYLRMFRHGTRFFGLAMPAQLYRSADGLRDFEAGPQLTQEPIPGKPGR